MDDREKVWIEFLEDGESLSGDLVGVIERLQSFLDAIPAEYRAEAVVDIDLDRGIYDDPTTLTESVGYYRPITDEELAVREAARAADVARNNAHREAQERATLEALKRKYG